MQKEAGTSALRSFLKRELDALLPLMSTTDAASLRADLSDENINPLANTPNSFERALVVAKTQTWNVKFGRPGNHLLCAAYDIGQWFSLAPLIEAAVRDQRISEVTFFGGGPAAREFQKQFGLLAQDLSDVGESALAAFNPSVQFRNGQSAIAQVDIAVATLSGRFGPDTWILNNAKSILGASKLVLIYDIYGAVPQNIPDSIDQIDLVLCSDDLTRECFLQTNRWEIDPSRVLIAETGQTVTPTDNQTMINLRQSGLRKLELNGEEVVVSLLGDMTIETDWGEGLSNNLAAETIYQSLQAIERFAKSNPKKNLAVVLRPHPADPRRELLEAALGAVKPSLNLKVRWSDSNLMSIDELAACSDAICSLYSTESFKASDRGIVGVFLNSSYFDQRAPVSLKQMLRDRQNLKVLGNGQELDQILNWLHSSKAGKRIESTVNVNSIAMIDAVLEKEH